MGIYIKGMKMPEGYTAWTLKVWPDGQVEIIDADGEWTTSEVVNVPPHGNLIDVNALPLEENVPTVMMHDGERWISVYELAMAPIIIPSSEGEE